MIQKTKLIVANWKMNPETEQEAKNLIEEVKVGLISIKNIKTVVCPPFIFIDSVKKNLGKTKNLILGAQDAFVGDGSSHTGEVGLEMLKKIGAKYIIIGHSERRDECDTDESIANKTYAVLKNNLKTILCVGEKERSEHGEHYNEIKKQLLTALSKIQKRYIKNLIVAYEPVWAIGKKDNEAINSEHLFEMTIFIKKILSDLLGHDIAKKIPLIYGGSVNKNNAKELLENGKVDGLLVGRESLKIKNFIDMIKSL